MEKEYWQGERLRFFFLSFFRYLRPFLSRAFGIGVVCCLLEYGLMGLLRMHTFAGLPCYMLDVSLR